LGETLARYRKHASNSYKNHRFMTDSILRIYDLYKEHPQYEAVRLRFLSSMFLKCSNRDRAFARELLAEIPLRHWNKKVFRGLGRLYFSPLEK
jgi:alpha-1,3-rhamnosyltransferase